MNAFSHASRCGVSVMSREMNITLNSFKAFGCIIFAANDHSSSPLAAPSNASGSSMTGMPRAASMSVIRPDDSSFAF